MSPLNAAWATWLGWYVTWCLAAFWASRAAARPPRKIDWTHRLWSVAGLTLVGLKPSDALRRIPPIGILTHPLWREPSWLSWTLVAGVAAGFGFCWWARLHLGRLWSGLVTVKADHRIIDTGPYRLVRHPIYTGVIFAALMTALIKASPCALIGFGLFAFGFWVTARLEERFLRDQLGAEAYDAYSRRTPMLVPGLL